MSSQSVATGVETAVSTATTTPTTTSTPITRTLAMPPGPASVDMSVQHQPTDSDVLACLLAMLQQRSVVEQPPVVSERDAYTGGSPSDAIHTLPSESTVDGALSLSDLASCGTPAQPSSHHAGATGSVGDTGQAMPNIDSQPAQRKHSSDPTTNAFLSSILGGDVVWGSGNALPELVNLLAAVASGGALKQLQTPTAVSSSEFVDDFLQRSAQQISHKMPVSGSTEEAMVTSRIASPVLPVIRSDPNIADRRADFLNDGLIRASTQSSSSVHEHHEGSDGLSLLLSPTSPLDLSSTNSRAARADLGSIVSIAAAAGDGAGSASIANELYGSIMALSNEDLHNAAEVSPASVAGEDSADKRSDKGSHAAPSAQSDKPQGPLFHKDGSLNLEFFKVFPCKNESHVHDRKNCPFHHSQRDRRRYPMTYKAEQCEDNFDIEGDFVCSCPKADNCDKCHNRHELLYHPEIYKQRFCSSYNHLACHRGRFCAFAHTREEIRCDLFLEEQERNPKPEFFMGKFKTLWCPYGIQHDWHGCLYAHTYQDCRRSPSIGYGSEPCPYWQKDLHSADYQKRCPFGPRCPYSHGSKEQLYHPAYYKTMPCADYKTKRACPREQLCAFYHDISEKRTPVPGQITRNSSNGEDTTEDSCAEVKIYDYTRPLPANLMRLLQPKFMWPPLFNLDDFEAFGHASRIGPPRKDSSIALSHSPLSPLLRPPYSPWSHEVLSYPSLQQSPQVYARSAPGKRTFGHSPTYGNNSGFSPSNQLSNAFSQIPQMVQYPGSFYESPFMRQRQPITTPMTAPSRFGGPFPDRRIPRPPTTHQQMQSFPRHPYR